MRILLVEDDAALREEMELILAERSEVACVNNVPDARKAMGEQRFDLVLADLRIGDDWSGGRQVVDSAVSHGTPVVVVTGCSRSDARRALGDSRPNEVLTKPFQLEDLELIIERYRAPKH